jgi:PAS domain S-box-containing protein
LLKNIGYQVALSIENALLYKEVRDSEEKYRLLTESANIGIISFTRKGKIFQFNKKAEDIFGFSRKEIVNKFAVELLPEKHSQLIEKLAKKFMSSGKHNTLDQSIVEHVKGKGGTSIPIEISYSIWGERLDPIITATIRDMR